MQKEAPISEDQPLCMIIVFDGDCALCSRWVRWSADRLCSPREVCWVPSQTQAGQFLLGKHGFGSSPDTLVVLFPDRELTRSAAVFAILRGMRSPYPTLARCLSWIPAPIRDGVYRAVASVRRRVGGNNNRCVIARSSPIRMEIPDPNNIHWKIL
jgi:predicted DCC family thiol-disulfide oxidoreductase YuxK